MSLVAQGFAKFAFVTFCDSCAFSRQILFVLCSRFVPGLIRLSKMTRGYLLLALQLSFQLRGFAGCFILQMDGDEFRAVAAQRPE